MRSAAIHLLICVHLFCGCATQAPEYDIVQAHGKYVRLPLAQVNDGKVHFYTYKYKGKNVNFLVRTDGKGKLHTHFDACYSCYKYKMGYRVEGDSILCIACSLTYKLSEETWDFIGPCAPIVLKSHVKEGSLLIEVARLEKGERLF